MMLLGRSLVAVLALLFAAAALGFWLAPETAAARIGLTALAPSGLASLRADLGGLFAGLAMLCALGAARRRAGFLYAASLMVSFILLGRVASWMLSAPRTIDVLAATIEVAACTALVFCARQLGRGDGERRTRSYAMVACGALAMTVAAGSLLASTAVQRSLFDAAAARLVRTEHAAFLDQDALRVAVCGTSAPLPSRRRAKACVAVAAGGRFYVVDAGPESVENLVEWSIPLARIGAVLLTHFHSDHIGELGELNLQTWAQGRPAPLLVYGGPGVARVVDGFNEAYRLDQTYRTAHHGAALMPEESWPLHARTIELQEDAGAQAVVLEENGLRILAIRVAHGPISPAYAYRFEYKGRSVLVTGDVEFHQPLAAAAANVDVLMGEALARPMVATIERSATSAGRTRVAAIMDDIQDYHISPQELAGIADAARASLLVLYHLTPAPDDFIQRSLFAEGLERTHGEWVIADDGSLYTLPAGSRDVHIGRID
jgi:ribonuclease Z